MENVLTALRQTRAQLKERGIDALDRVRSGALDWHETLKARRAELDANEPKWLGWAALQRRVIDGVDRVLVRFSDRVRAEMKRLSGLELPEVIEANEPAQLVEAGEPKPAEPKLEKAAKAEKTAPAKAKRPSAKAPKRKAGAANASKSLVLPIASYDKLSARDVVAELPRLSDAQCKTLLAHEKANKKRKTVVSALETRLAS